MLAKSSLEQQPRDGFLGPLWNGRAHVCLAVRPGAWLWGDTGTVGRVRQGRRSLAGVRVSACEGAWAAWAVAPACCWARG